MRLPFCLALASLPVSLVFALPGCGDSDGGATGADGGTTSGGTTTTTSTSSAGTTTTGNGTDGTDSGIDPSAGECILWDNDCPGELKCMPWSEQADRLPDETRCCAAVDNPDLVDEPCTVLDYDGSCLDTCEPGSMCLVDDVDVLSGQCRQFCTPGGSDCAPNQTCKAFFELLDLVLNVPICMAQCDPLLPNDCDQPGWRCIPDTPTESGQSGFICVPPPPSPPKALFEACALANDCQAGLVCVVQSRVPDCTFTSCCSAYCSLSEADPCPALHPEMRCTDWMSPDPTWVDVGVCAIPDG